MLVQDTIADGPAANAGLKSGDIVMRVGRARIRNMKQFRNAVANTKPGTRMRLRIFRDGRERDVEVVAGSGNSQRKSETRTGNAAATMDDLGLSVETLSPELASRLNASPNERAVVITRVARGSLAERAGLRRGDLILSVGRTVVTSVSEFLMATKDLDVAQGVRIQVKRGGVRTFVILRKL